MKKTLSIYTLAAILAVSAAHAETPASQEYVDWRLGDYTTWADWNANTEHVAQELQTINESLYGRPESSPGAGDAVAGLLPGDPAYGLGRGLIAEMSDSMVALSDGVREMENKFSAGVANSNALSGLDNHLDADKDFGIGFGAGYYNSAGGFAAGAILRTSVNSAFSAGAAVSTEGDFSAKAGWNMQF